MKRIIRKWAIAAALTGATPMAWTLADTPKSPEKAANFKEEQIIVVKESGEPDRRCVIVSLKKLPDGVTAYQVQALDTGEMLTINDRMPTAPTPEQSKVPLASFPAAPVQPASDGNYKENQIINLRGAGKSDRLCTIVSVRKEPHGLVTYQVKALDNGDMLTIRNRPPVEPAQRATVQPPAEPKPGEMNSNAKRAANLTPDTTDKLGADLPRAKERWNDPLDPLSPSTAENAKPSRVPSVMAKASVAQPVTAAKVSTPMLEVPDAESATTSPATVPVKPSRFSLPRVLGKSPAAMPAPCATCTDPAAAPQQVAGRAIVSTVEPPTGYGQPASVARHPMDPVPIGYGPQTPLGVPMMREPMPLPLNQAPFAEPAKLTADHELKRFAEMRDALLTLERPSQRIAVAEELAFGPRGATPDVRAALMLAAQDDPAGCVRAACIRCLSKQDVRDRAFMSLIVAAQHDKDADVREESAFALQKAMRK